MRLLWHFLNFKTELSPLFPIISAAFARFLQGFRKKKDWPFGKIEIGEKTRQNAENKQTFHLNGKIEIREKTRQNAENKQTFD